MIAFTSRTGDPDPGWPTSMDPKKYRDYCLYRVLLCEQYAQIACDTQHLFGAYTTAWLHDAEWWDGRIKRDAPKP